jgi:hypothetical protein
MNTHRLSLPKARRLPFAKWTCLALACAAFSMPADAQTPPPATWLGGFEGINSGWIPADPTIAAGPDSIVTMVSGKIAIHNKQGVKLFEQNLGAGGFWAAVGGDQVPEPWVIFDPHSERFIALAREVAGETGRVYLAVSMDSTPSGSTDWYKHALNMRGTHLNPANAGEFTMPDFPKAGVDAQALYITTNHYGYDSAVFSHNLITAIPKAALLSGGTPQIVHEVSFTSLFGPLHPVMVHDPVSPMYFVTQDPDFDTVTVYALADVLTSSPDLTYTTVTVPAFDQPPPVPQLGTSTTLYAFGSRFTTGVVRDGSLWTAHHISDPAVDSEALVRWYLFDVTGFPGATTLAKSGNVDPGPGKHAFLPAINVDAEGNMGLTFTVSGASQYAAIGYTGRRAADPDGFTLPVQIARAGEGPYNQDGWGQYCGLAMDPDGSTFWLFHEYPIKQKGNGGAWRTYVGAFELLPPAPPANPLHCGDLDGSSVAQSSSKWRASVTVTMHDGNDDPVQGASVTVWWSTNAAATATTDANGRCTFTLGNLSRQSTPSVSMEITNATHATLTYNSGVNHDADGDSNGTSIVVTGP